MDLAAIDALPDDMDPAQSLAASAWSLATQMGRSWKPVSIAVTFADGKVLTMPVPPWVQLLRQMQPILKLTGFYKEG
jgi:hypothetical protein